MCSSAVGFSVIKSVACLFLEIECPPDCMIGGRALKLHQTVQVSCPPKQRFECGLETMNVTCFANGVAKMSPYSTCGRTYVRTKYNALREKYFNIVRGLSPSRIT